MSCSAWHRQMTADQADSNSALSSVLSRRQIMPFLTFLHHTIMCRCIDMMDIVSAFSTDVFKGTGTESAGAIVLVF